MSDRNFIVAMVGIALTIFAFTAAFGAPAYACENDRRGPPPWAGPPSWAGDDTPTADGGASGLRQVNRGPVASITAGVALNAPSRVEGNSISTVAVGNAARVRITRED